MSADVIFVFDEHAKEAACCVVSKEEKHKYPNQIYKKESCSIVYDNMAECERIMKNTS